MQIIRHRYQANNIGKVERVASLMAGALLFSRGLRTKGWFGTASALLGIAFMRRGITGFCYTYQALGINSAGIAIPSGVRIDEAMTLNLPREEVYRFWRDLTNIIPAMQHVESAHTLAEGNRSNWIMKMPGGARIEFDAELINEKPNELIAWRSVHGSEISHAGSVHFRDAAAGRGTEIKLELWYRPDPFGTEDFGWIHQDLQRLKARIEAGVLPETNGQPVGPRNAEQQEEKHAHNDAVAKASEESFPASDSPAFSH